MGPRKNSDGLFDSVAKKLQHLPFDTPEFIDRIVSGSIDEAGRRTLQTLIIRAARSRPVRSPRRESRAPTPSIR